MVINKIKCAAEYMIFLLKWWSHKLYNFQQKNTLMLVMVKSAISPLYLKAGTGGGGHRSTKVEHSLTPIFIRVAKAKLANCGKSEVKTGNKMAL